MPASNSNKTMFEALGRRKASLLLCLLSGLSPVFATAMPVNPQRPYIAEDCEVAEARLIEALMGNPLISKEEMVKVLATARDGAERLCGVSFTQEIVTDFNIKNIQNSK